MPSRWQESTRVTEADVVLSKYGGMNPIAGGISAGDGRCLRLDRFWRPLAALLRHWQLEHRHILPRAKLGH